METQGHLFLLEVWVVIDSPQQVQSTREHHPLGQYLEGILLEFPANMKMLDHPYLLEVYQVLDSPQPVLPIKEHPHLELVQDHQHLLDLALGDLPLVQALRHYQLDYLTLLLYLVPQLFYLVPL